MFGLGWLEVGLILLAAVLVFGPKKIPELGNSFGKTLRGFRDGLKESNGTGSPNTDDSADSDQTKG